VRGLLTLLLPHALPCGFALDVLGQLLVAPLDAAERDPLRRLGLAAFAGSRPGYPRSGE